MLYNKKVHTQLISHVSFVHDENDTRLKTADDFQEMFEALRDKNPDGITLSSFGDFSRWESSDKLLYDKSVIATYVSDVGPFWIGLEGHHSGKNYRIVLFDEDGLWHSLMAYNDLDDLIVWVNKVANWAAKPGNSFSQLQPYVDYKDAKVDQKELFAFIWGNKAA